MQEILSEIISTIDQMVSEQETRVAIYSEIIPHIRWHDAELVESLRDESEAFAEAFELVLENSEEFLDEDY